MAAWDRCDNERRLVFGTLDNQRMSDYGGRLGLYQSWSSDIVKASACDTEPLLLIRPVTQVGL